jgi:hypothetical protein
MFVISNPRQRRKLASVRSLVWYVGVDVGEGEFIVVFISLTRASFFHRVGALRPVALGERGRALWRTLRVRPPVAPPGTTARPYRTPLRLRLKRV